MSGRESRNRSSSLESNLSALEDPDEATSFPLSSLSPRTTPQREDGNLTALEYLTTPKREKEKKSKTKKKEKRSQKSHQAKLLSKRRSTMVTDDPNKSLFHCCVVGDLATIEWLVEMRHPSMNYKILDENDPLLPSRYYQVGDTPIAVAKRYNNDSIVKYLFSKLQESGEAGVLEGTSLPSEVSPERDFKHAIKNLLSKNKRLPKRGKGSSTLGQASPIRKRKQQPSPTGFRRNSSREEGPKTPPPQFTAPSPPRQQRYSSAEYDASDWSPNPSTPMGVTSELHLPQPKEAPFREKEKEKEDKKATFRSRVSRPRPRSNLQGIISPKSKSRQIEDLEYDDSEIRVPNDGKEGVKEGVKEGAKEGTWQKEDVEYDVQKFLNSEGYFSFSSCDFNPDSSTLPIPIKAGAVGFLELLPETFPPGMKGLKDSNSRETLGESDSRDLRKQDSARFSIKSRRVKTERLDPRDSQSSITDLAEQLQPISSSNMPRLRLEEVLSAPKSFSWMLDQISNQSTIWKELVQIFFLTYQKYSNWEDVVRGLLIRWNASSSKTLFLVFHHWMTTYSIEDWGSEKSKQFSALILESQAQIVDAELSLFREMMSGIGPEFPDQIVGIIRRDNLYREKSRRRHTELKKLKKTKMKVSTDGMSKNSSTDGESDWMIWDEIFVADQLALFHWNLFAAIRPREVLDYNLSKKKKEDCPNLSRLVENFNRIAYWVISEVVVRVRLAERVTILEKFISIANLSLHINNFFGAKALYTGICHPALSRMSKTMDHLSRETKSRFTKLHRILELDGTNGASYRAALKGARPPFVPHFGIHLKDLVYTFDGNQTFSELDGFTEPEINFSKFLLIWEQISGLAVGCTQSYEGTVDEKVTDFLSDLPNMEDKLFFVWSNRVEPKNMETLIANFIDNEMQLNKSIEELTLRLREKTKALEFEQEFRKTENLRFRAEMEAKNKKIAELQREIGLSPKESPKMVPHTPKNELPKNVKPRSFTRFKLKKEESREYYDSPSPPSSFSSSPSSPSSSRRGEEILKSPLPPPPSSSDDLSLLSSGSTALDLPLYLSRALKEEVDLMTITDEDDSDGSDDEM